MLALLFPGQGSQEVGMGRDVFDASPAARAAFETADEALGLDLSRLCFEGPAEELRRTEIQQPAILTTSVALLRALEEQASLAPAYVAGHSLGEYTALVAAGALDLAEAARLVHARGRFMQEAVPAGAGGMYAVMGTGADVVSEACAAVAEQTGRVVAPANFNGPKQTVIAGDAQAAAQAAEAAKARGARKVVALPVSAPFHCELMRPAADKLAAELGRITFRDPTVPVVTNVEAEPNRDGARIAALLEQQVTAPVRFTESIERLVALGVTEVLEVGPGHVLAGLVARIDRGLGRSSASTWEEVQQVAKGRS